MAENESGQEKSEAATPRRRQRSREEGQIPKSMEVNTSILLLSGVIAFYFFADDFYGQIGDSIRLYLHQSATFVISPESIYSFLLGVADRVLVILTPFFIMFFIIALIINIAQVGFVLTPKALRPKLSKLNPIKGIQNLFSMRGRVQLLKSVAKMLIIAPVMIYTVYVNLPDNMILSLVDIKDILIHIGIKSLDLAIKALIIMLILSFLDYIYQRWQSEQDMKMSKEEVRQEMKDIQGDPKIKQRIRSIQQEMSRRRMMESVPEAEVVVTNPTEYAIALKYDPGEFPAPIVVAKGKNILAKKIKDIANEHDVPIVENKPLAQSMYKLVAVGHPIPPDLYQAVAEVLAYVYKLKKRMPEEEVA
jgi:flagellar biosynthesis protein FlhB